jgi:hypothetical protein
MAMIATGSELAGRVRLWAAWRGALLGALCAAVGCASSSVPAAPRGRGARPEPALQLPDAGPWQRFEVQRHGFSKKVTFREAETARTWGMEYKGIPVGWTSPINLLVDEDLYAKRSHRVRYRFEHPFTGQPLVLHGRARSRSVAGVPIPPRAAAPLVEILDRDGERSLGSFAYDPRSLVLLTGRLGARQVEIEQVDPGARRPKGPLGYLVTPFPITGEFVVWMDGRDAARFVKRRQRGALSRYDLAVRKDLVPEWRDDAVLAFLVFDLMKDFVEASVG